MCPRKKAFRKEDKAAAGKASQPNQCGENGFFFFFFSFSSLHFTADIFGQTYMHTFTRRVRAQSQSARLSRTPGAAWRSVSRTVLQVWSKQRIQHTKGSANQKKNKHLKEKPKVNKKQTWGMVVLCTFNLQLSSTSVLIRLSHPSVNHAGSLKHRDDKTYSTQESLFSSVQFTFFVRYPCYVHEISEINATTFSTQAV